MRKNIRANGDSDVRDVTLCGLWRSEGKRQSASTNCDVLALEGYGITSFRNVANHLPHDSHITGDQNSKMNPVET
jgi:hypothetical protein